MTQPAINCILIMKGTSRSEPATLPIKTVTVRPLNSETRCRFITSSPVNLPNSLKTYHSLVYPQNSLVRFLTVSTRAHWFLFWITSSLERRKLTWINDSARTAQQTLRIRYNNTGIVRINVTMRHVRTTTAAEEKQYVLLILNVCL